MAETSALTRFDFNQVPGLRQVLLLVGIAAAVAIGVGVVLWSRSPDYALLYSTLPPKDAAAVVQSLQTDGIKYQLNNSTGAIMVPSSVVAKARLKLAAEGLPHSGNVGMDIIASNGSGFGTSSFMQKARYQQLLEQDLAKTIASLDSVKSASVHLALPEQSAFIRRRQAASASILVDLFPGRELNRSQVAAIVHLVASSVPALDPEHVTVVDQQGVLLTDDAKGAMGLSQTQYRLRHRIEQNYSHRVLQILTPLVGAGNVHAEVVAAMDFTRKESTSETYNPDKVLRSEQTHKSVQRGNQTPIGIPGALSNQPPTTPAQNTTANGKQTTAQTQQKPQNSSTSATRNYELSHTISHITTPVGEIKRLSVAVVIDSPTHVSQKGKTVATPLSQQELAKLTTLVKSAVGFDAARGDTVSVVNAPFKTIATPAAIKVPWWKKPVAQTYIKEGLGVLIALALILFILRPLFRNLMHLSLVSEPRRLARPEGEVIEAEDDLDADQISLSGEAPPGSQVKRRAMSYDEKVGVAKRVVSDDPRRVAQVVKHWVGDDG